MSLIERGAKSVLKRALGSEGIRRIRHVEDRVRIILRNGLTADGRHSRRLLAFLKDRYLGDRCIIIGNGPSLKMTDLTRLRDEYTFGQNRIYLMFDELGFSTSYLVAVNRYVLEQSGTEIEKQECLKILGWAGRQHVRTRKDVAFIQSSEIPQFSRNPLRYGVFEGATVTYVAMQLAFYMGFRQVVLVGVDHTFATKGPPKSVVTSAGPDPNHFHPDYFGRGYRWQLPDLETSTAAYEMAREQFEEAGGAILDATIGGKLRVFPKVEYDDIFPPFRSTSRT